MSHGDINDHMVCWRCITCCLFFKDVEMKQLYGLHYVLYLQKTFLLHTIIIQYLLIKKLRTTFVPSTVKIPHTCKMLRQSARKQDQTDSEAAQNHQKCLLEGTSGTHAPQLPTQCKENQSWFRLHRTSLSHILKFARVEVRKCLWAIFPGALTSQNKPTEISHVYNVQPLPLLDSLCISENELIFHSVLF